MNDFELESRLKTVRVPAKTDEYWEEFPAAVRSQLPRPVPAERRQADFLPNWAWSGGVALVCVVLAVLLWPVAHALLKDERVLQREAARLPHQLHLLMADQHGMQYLVQE